MIQLIALGTPSQPKKKCNLTVLSTTADCSYFVYIRSLKTLGPLCLSLPQLLSSAILLFVSIRFETLISDPPLFSKHHAFWPNIYKNCYLYYCLCIILVNSWFCCGLSDRNNGCPFAEEANCEEAYQALQEAPKWQEDMRQGMNLWVISFLFLFLKK